MIVQFLQRYTAEFFAIYRRLCGRFGRWLRASPRLSGWFYAPLPELHPDAAYRGFNGWYFAQWDEQERMLADGPRMAFYDAAIKRHIQPGDRVIDLGTGTGILAALASRRGASAVYALDHSEILEDARLLAEYNGIQNTEFIAKHSTDFHVAEPVDVILHEQIGDYLFDEAMVANVCDLRDRMLKPGGLILPSQFEFFCEPVTLQNERHVPFIWEMNVMGYNYACLESKKPDNPEYYRQASCDLGVVKAFLGEPAPSLNIDLHTVTENTIPREVSIERRVTRAGPLHGLAVFFRTAIDDDLVLTSDPLDPGRAPHWGFRILRTAHADPQVGDVITIKLTVGRWSDPDTWQWDYQVPGPASNLG